MSSHRHLIRFAMSLIAGALACGGAGDGSTGPSTSGTPGASTATVAATPDLAFSPASASIAHGGTVTWEFGSVSHSVAFDRAAGTVGGRDENGYYTGTTDSAPADIPATQGTKVARAFGVAGTYTYHCLIHAGMSGTVTVR